MAKPLPSAKHYRKYTTVVSKYLLVLMTLYWPNLMWLGQKSEIYATECTQSKRCSTTAILLPILIWLHIGTLVVSI